MLIQSCQSCCVVGSCPNKAKRDEKIGEVMIHELCHLFGAAHEEDESMMGIHGPSGESDGIDKWFLNDSSKKFLW